MIFAFAAETLANTIVFYTKKKKQVEIRYRSSEMLKYLVGKDIYIKIWRGISAGAEKLKDKVKTSPIFLVLVRWGYRAIFLGILLAYGSTSLFTVRWDEEAIVERLGKSLDHASTLGPGLHLKLPWPLDRVVKVNTQKVRMLNLGNMTGTDLPLLWTVSHGNELSFISGDNNFFNPYIVIHYRIKDPFAFHYKHAQPEGLLEYASYNVISETFAVNTFYDVSIFNRFDWENKCKERIQEKLDGMQTGIEILNFLAKDIHPPLSISRSYEEVIAAYQEKQRLLNEATGYGYIHIPAARVMAFNDAAAAAAYVKEKVKMAEGDAKRYLLQLAEYRKSKSIIRRRFYFNAINETLRFNVKVLIDPKAEVEDFWLTK
jgi:membrane protease subunit HflK